MDRIEWLLWLLPAALIFLAFIWIVKLWWKPFYIARHFHAQGIYGPPYHFFFGNLPEIKAMLLHEHSKQMDSSSNDLVSQVLPYYKLWSESYGKPFLFWFGSKPRLAVGDPHLVKKVMSTRVEHFPKPPIPRGGGEIGGYGLASLHGKKWAQHRRIINPLFYMESLKDMSSTIEACIMEMVEKWQKMLNAGQNEIEVFEQFRVLTGDVIARTAFGSNFVEGRRVFQIQIEQAQFVAEALRSVEIPVFRYFPTYKNRRRWKLRKEVIQSMRQLITNRLQQANTGRIDGYGNDLLGLLLSANRRLEEESHAEKEKTDLLSIDEIVDECRTFFFAGHETTSTLLTWTMLLLSQHLDWQEKARAEVIEVCGGKNLPSVEILSHLKIVGMILLEALRLYSPAVALTRQTFNPMKLGELSIPGGTQLFIPILAMHHDPAIWGEDAQQFNPQRFENGVAKACKDPMAFMPFGAGPRICVGQNFGLVEAKLALSTILQHFAFHLSPTYKHAPITIITLQPQHGVQIIFEAIEM